MSLKIRLARHGAKKRPFYRIVVADTRNPRDGRFIERLGHFNPLLPKDHDDRIKVDGERVRHWMGNGARPTDRVARLLGQLEIIPAPPQRNNPIKAKPKKKAQERLAAKAEAEKAAAEAESAQAAPAEAESAEEAPAEEAPAEEAPAAGEDEGKAEG